MMTGIIKRLNSYIIVFLFAICLSFVSGCTEKQDITDIATSVDGVENVVYNTENVDITESDIDNYHDLDDSSVPLAASPFVGDDMNVYFIDVGEGDSTLVKCGEEAMLIDAGDANMGSSIRLFLKQCNVDSLKYLLLTHSDADHIGGAASVVSNVPIDTVFMCQYEKDNKTYNNLLNELNYKSLGWSTPNVGEVYALGDATFVVVAPNDVYDNPNDSSIAIVLEHGANRFLFTGDCEENAEYDITKNGIDISCDVYHVGHHGSYTSTSDVLLNAANPQYAVISCGRDNKYGHPHEETMSKLQQRNIDIFRTDVQGTILATSDGKNIVFSQLICTDWSSGSSVTELDDDSMQCNPVESIDIPETSIVNPVATDASYVVNINTGKFHYPDCSSVSEMKPKNRMDVTCSKDELISQGYVPCKRCNP